VFVDEGPSKLSLLRVIAKQRIEWDYGHRLVEAYGDGGTNRPGRPAQGLVDPLSERELVVLRLLGSDLDGPAIAHELVVSLNTLRTHTRPPSSASTADGKQYVGPGNSILCRRHATADLRGGKVHHAAHHMW
jgi:hypothetical protein